MLGLLGCDLRVVEDETGRHARQVLQGWKLLVRQLRGARPAPAQAAALVAEAEYWLLRLRRIREGRLKLMRWSAIVQGPMLASTLMVGLNGAESIKTRATTDPL